MDFFDKFSVAQVTVFAYSLVFLVLEVLLAFFGEFCLFGVLENSFLAVDDAFDVTFRLLNFNESEVCKLCEAVSDFVVFEDGSCLDFLGVVVAVVDGGEDGAIFVS